jgi:hypothetical protein
MTGDRLVNPERPPAGVVGAVAMVVIVEPGKASLNRKSSPPPAPVSTNLLALASDTVKLTLVPDWTSVTVPNTVPAAGHPDEIWHEVKLNVSADVAPAPARTNPDTNRDVNTPDFIFIGPSLEYNADPASGTDLYKRPECSKSICSR